MTLLAAPPPPRRRIGLTPMIDVVFLLLVFFMLASRFGTEGAIPVAASGAGGGGYQGAPRLVEALPDGFRLNGVVLTPEALTARLAALLPGPEAVVVVRARGGADLQRLTEAMDLVRAAGARRIALAE
ncbi:MAG: biopolymer transporter ExbD [Pseudomonadota bacterium]|nr:biopolymer transporter ExbD [Pseudomonadota bacterium]